MFKRATTALILSLFCLSANAALTSRLSGQAYYDDVLNITWVADANLSRTSGYDDNGQMTWYDAQAWIASLNTASYLGFSDWRLPSADVNADTGVIDCSLDTEPNCRDNEMGYMYWHNGVRGDATGSQFPFTNLVPNRYWSGTDGPPVNGAPTAWQFSFNFGPQLNDWKDSLTGFAWAVRPGDIGAVPVPAAVWLLGSALGLLGWIRRKTTA